MTESDNQQPGPAAAASDGSTDRLEPGNTISSSHLRGLAKEAHTAIVIYGIIVASAVMASAQGETLAQLAVAVLVTLVIYWAAERYARVMAGRIVRAQALDWPQLRRELGHGWELVTASFLPLGVLLGSRLLGATLSGAIFAALVSGVVVLSTAGWQVGREAGLRRWPRVLSAACAGAFGIAMILLKALLH